MGEKKNPQDLWARFSSLYPRKKNPQDLWARFSQDFLAYPREKKNLQDLWDYFLGSKINKICGPHILLIFFLQEKWIYPQDSHVSCPRNSKISLEELYRDSVEVSRESVEVRRESVVVSRESVKVSRESVEVSRESVDISRDSVEASRSQ